MSMQAIPDGRREDEQVTAHEPLGQTLYLAAEGYLDDLLAELGEFDWVEDRLVFAAGPPRPAAWAQNIWVDPVRIPIVSIGEGARALRGMQRNWALHSLRHHRRAQLIQDKLPPIKVKPYVFGTPLPKAPMGSWLLWDEGTIIAAPHCSSPFAHGEVTFAEDREAPPNRAYLKLWEALTLLDQRPQPGERCLDLGSSPGGWTWVLQQCGAQVVSVDKAPLDESIAALPNIDLRRQSAFALEPDEVGPVDWLCCDIICYPSRLWQLVERWREADLVRNFICTLKFQGPTDHDSARLFAEVPGARLLHLSHNKHELTWIWQRS